MSDIHQADYETQYELSVDSADEENNWKIAFHKKTEDNLKEPPIIRARATVERRIYGLIRSFESRTNFQVSQITLTRNDKGYLTVQVIIKYKD